MPKARELRAELVEVGRTSKRQSAKKDPPWRVKNLNKMQIRIFNIPINDNGASQAEMNRFLAG